MTSPRHAYDALASAEQPGQALPQIPCDPSASLEPLPIEVSYLGRDWVISAMTAREWLAILWAEDLSVDTIFPGLVDGYDALLDGLIDGTTTSREAFEVAMDILEAAGGYKWWFTLRLVTLAKIQWPQFGWYLRHDLGQISLGMFLTEYLGLCLKNSDPTQAARLVMELNAAPPEFATEIDEINDGEAFLAAMRQSL
jgi:hypothetical protein